MKKIKILTITLAIIAITMIAFFGIYTQVQNRMENQVKDYSYAMNLKGSRNIKLTVNTEKTTVVKDAEGNEVTEEQDLTDEQIAEKGYTKEEIVNNPDEVKNMENYKVSQKIIEERLKKAGVDYIIKLNEQTGDIVIELPEDEQTDAIVNSINTTGKFQIMDTKTNEVLMDNSNIKLARVMYGSSSSTTSTGTSVYLDIEFNKEGTKKLEEVSNQYVKIKNTTEEQNSTDENKDTAEEKTITMKVDDKEIMSTSFEEPIRTGKLQLSIGSSTTDTDALQGYIEQASGMATVLDTGNMPIKYDLSENQYIFSDLTEKQVQTAIYVVLAIMIVGFIVWFIQYRLLATLGVISYIGFLSLFTIVIRYANVMLSIEGVLGIVIVLLLNYLLVSKLLAKINEKKIEVYKEFFVKIIPIIILAIAFCFMSWMPLSSFGMVMFWGIVLIMAYNIIVTNSFLKINAGKDK